MAMKTLFTKEEMQLLKAKSPDAYIDKSLKSEISPGRKAFVTKFWLQQTGYNSGDLANSRNRHPYCKAKKMEGTPERNAIRSSTHNYGDGNNIEWDEKLINRFIDMNKKEKNGKYIYKDWQLAKEFKCTIAAIQHMRRKANMAEKILSTESKKSTDKRLLPLLKMGEGTLRAMVRNRKK